MNGEINNNLWAGTSLNKTIYDPCPEGWMVPRSDGAEGSVWHVTGLSYPQWSKPELFKGTWINGWNFVDDYYPLGYYPAAGYRSPNNGSLYSINSQGYCWSGVNNGVLAWAFQVNRTDIDRSAFLGRGAGVSVRCVKETFVSP